MNSLPDWVKPSAIALHQSSEVCTLFTIQGIKKVRDKDVYFLNPWASGSGITFPLNECQAAKPELIPDVAEYLSPKGHRLQVVRIPIGFAVSLGQWRFGVKLPQENELAAAQNLAQAFSGEIVELDHDDW
ncbi:MAG: hypothetical protein KME13_23970 [Myxacorys californica WJT36-NPBG1]|jgi:hypothetical protein|nr:hypothetical protein [Myxacorys californica WJT36-NPBG1]